LSDTPDEFSLIAELFAPLARGYPGALGLIDDAALVAEQPGTEIVVTVDAMVAGVHFLPTDAADLVARKLVRVNLSDLAAKGARPFAVLLAAAFPHGTGRAWLEAFAAGLGADLQEFGIALIGGDTVATPGPLTLSLTAMGRVEAGNALLRSGAKAGDELWMSGTLGDGALGLLAAQGLLTTVDAEAVDYLADCYRLPRPRVTLGPSLVGLANAAMDVSDGLAQDLEHLCRASGLGAIVETTALPLSPAARQAIDADQSQLARALTGGDDYEILFTVPPGAADTLHRLAGESAVPLTLIGRMVQGSAVTLLDEAGRPIAVGQGGWRHFSTHGSGAGT
jgi:thiamine-monophosphate kinase